MIAVPFFTQGLDKIIINDEIGCEMKEIWFIRHGQSEANAGLPTDDSTNIALTEIGYDQAAKIARTFSYAPELIVMSPYKRTQQTAAPTIERFKSVPTEIWPFQEFDYLCPIKCRGTTLEMRRGWAEAYWQRCDPFYYDGQAPESFNDFRVRVFAQLEELTHRKEKFIAAFVHGQVMRAILQYLQTDTETLNMTYFRDNMLPVNIGNGELLKCYFDSEKWKVVT